MKAFGLLRSRSSIRGFDNGRKWRERTPWSWTMEIIQLLISLASMVWLVCLLIRYDNKPLSDWTFYVSFPATLAILSTASRAAGVAAVGTCLSQYKWLHLLQRPRKLEDLDLIDEASRGTIGSLWLIFQRAPSLATLGAIFTITSLGYGTFVQQLIVLTPRDVLVEDAHAVLDLNHFYDTGARPDFEPGGIFTVREMTTDLSMQGAIYKGLFSLGTTPVFNCSSVCEWRGTYVSLGFAATCADVTNATLDAHGNATGVWNDKQWYFLYDDEEDGDENDHDMIGVGEFNRVNPRDMNLTTPSGVPLSAAYQRDNYRTAVSLGAVGLLNTTEGRSFAWIMNVDEAGNVINMTKPLLGTAIARVAALRINVPGYVITNPYTDMEIVQCDIHLAAHRYKDVVASGGKLSFARRETVPLPQAEVILTNIPSDEDESGRLYVYEAWFPAQDGLPRLGIRTHELVAIEMLLTSDRFVGNIYDGMSAMTPAPSGLGAAFRHGNLTAPFHAMVESMTDQIRANLSNPAAVTGRTVQSVLFITVSWPWLVLPLAGTVISNLFVMIIIAWVYKHRDEIPAWKSKFTPALMHQIYFLEGESDNDRSARLVTDFHSVADLKKYTKKIRAQLEPPRKGGGPGEDGVEKQDGQDGSEIHSQVQIEIKPNLISRRSST